MLVYMTIYPYPSARALSGLSSILMIKLFHYSEVLAK
ncbi:hypothetical protein PSYCG_07230 [Psychrobacter sp. G]|nr:hypothetical protein PSYCG_07230 [Psychrobacter sp. G]